MQVWVRPDGRRDRRFRPYIEQEELDRNFTLYDPEGRGVNYGLYETAQPSCGIWQDHFLQSQQPPKKSVFFTPSYTGGHVNNFYGYRTVGSARNYTTTEYDPLFQHVYRRK